MPKVDDIERKWYVVDANGMILGRLASRVAQILRGKHKTLYAPHIDLGDHVIIINAEKVRVTGKKSQKKMYFWHTMYSGGLRSRSMADLFKEKPQWILEHAIKRMLPNNRLGRSMFKKLNVYVGDQHPHQAQKPEVLDLSQR